MSGETGFFVSLWTIPRRADTELWDVRDVDRPASDIEAAIANRTHLGKPMPTEGSRRTRAGLIREHDEPVGGGVSSHASERRREPSILPRDENVSATVAPSSVALSKSTTNVGGLRLLGSALRCRGTPCTASSAYARVKGMGCLECAGCDSGCAYSQYST